MNIRVLGLVLLYSCTAIVPAAIASTPRIAVLPFGGDTSATLQIREFVANKLGAELSLSRKYQVLDRSHIGQILEEQDFQQSEACNTSQCQVKIGQLLSVDQLVTGTLLRMGNHWIYQVDLLDVETGKVLLSVDREEAGALEDSYRMVLQSIATEIVARQDRNANSGLEKRLQFQARMDNEEYLDPEKTEVLRGLSLDLPEPMRQELYQQLALEELHWYDRLNILGISSFQQGDWVAGYAVLALEVGGILVEAFSHTRSSTGKDSISPVAFIGYACYIGGAIYGGYRVGAYQKRSNELLRRVLWLDGSEIRKISLVPWIGPRRAGLQVAMTW
jgi:TolB-like protein